MRTITAATALAVLLAAPALAQEVTGTVKKVDAEAGKITIDHGPIKRLDMDRMTMVFRVADPDMLKQVKAGDRIRFDADRVNGAITVTKMVRQK
jgi:Cu/Ag efflux protein CusF